jgi:hypothetical protein
MQARNVTQWELEAAAEAVGLELGPGSHPGRFTLNLGQRDEHGRRKYQRLSAIPSYHGGKQRRVNAVCWHGHRDFMFRLFDARPEAVLSSGIIRYRGREDFLAKFESTGDRNIGSIASPMAYREACTCQEAGTERRPVASRGVH